MVTKDKPLRELFVVSRAGGVSIVVDSNNMILNKDSWEELKNELDKVYYEDYDSFEEYLDFNNEIMKGSITKENKNNKQNEVGKVYLVKSKNHYKIGVTKKSIDSRIKQLQTGSPYKIYLIKKWELNEIYELERKMHKEFKVNNSIGEWFLFKEDKLDEVISIIDREYKNIVGRGN